MLCKGMRVCSECVFDSEYLCMCVCMNSQLIVRLQAESSALFKHDAWFWSLTGFVRKRREQLLRDGLFTNQSC